MGDEGAVDAILAEALRGTSERSAVLADMRARAGWTLAAASVAGAVLIQDADHGPAFVVALAAFGMIVGAVVWSYWPRRWRDTMNVDELVHYFLDADDAPGTWDLKRDIALKHYELYEEHKAPLFHVQVATMVSLAMLGVFVAALFIDRM